MTFYAIMEIIFFLDEKRLILNISSAITFVPMLKIVAKMNMLE